MTPLRLAVIGTGHLGKIHARLAAQHENAQLVAVCDLNTEACEAVAREFGAEAVFDYQKLAGKVDAVILATPTTSHHTIAADLLKAGLPTLVEKPIALNADEANHLVQLAEQHEVVLQVGHVERFNPVWTAAQESLRGAKYIESSRLSGYTFRSTDIGVVLDLMIHDLDLVLSTIRSPLKSVSAQGIAVFGENEDIANAHLTFEDGCVVNLTASRVSYERRRQMQVFTTTGFVGLDFDTRQLTTITPPEEMLRRDVDFSRLDHSEQVDIRDHLFEALLEKKQSIIEPNNAILAEQENFITSVLTTTRPLVSGADGRDAILVADAILASIAEHQWDGKTLGRCGPMAMPHLPINVSKKAA